MILSKWNKVIFLVFLAFILLGVGLFVSQRIPALQVKTSLWMTWIRGFVSPSGTLPTAEVEDEQAVFWLPDLIDVQTEPVEGDEAVQPKRVNSTLPDSVILSSPAFNPHKDYQDWNNCGPATLALALRYWGWNGDQFTISQVIRPKRQDKNVNIEELAEYVDQNVEGYQAVVRMGGDQALLKTLIAGGYPVIIEESFKLEKAAWPGDDLWAGHYLLLTGYDEQKRLFTVQDSFYGPDQLLSYDHESESWQSFNHVYLVIFPSGDLHKLEKFLAEDWSTDTNLTRTAAALQTQLRLEPGNAFAWFNLGTTLAAQQDYKSAVQAFNKARILGVPQRMLRYQFGPMIAAYQTGNVIDLAQLADYALKVTPDSEEALLWKGRAFELAGDKLSAVAMFKKALEANPGYQDAEKALLSVRP